MNYPEDSLQNGNPWSKKIAFSTIKRSHYEAMISLLFAANPSPMMGEFPISLLFGKKIATNKLSVSHIGNPNIDPNEVIIDSYGNQVLSTFTLSSYPGLPNNIMENFPIPLSSPDFIVPSDATGAYFFFSIRSNHPFTYDYTKIKIPLNID